MTAKITQTMIALTLTLTVASCTAAGTNGTAAPGEWGINKTTGGTALGGIVGGLAGSQFGGGVGKLATTAVGTVAGAFIGHEIGVALDRADQAAAQPARQQATTAPVGKTIAWNNPDNGHAGTVTPTRDGRDQAGNYCREYETTVTVTGETKKAFGTACQQPDGTWKVVN